MSGTLRMRSLCSNPSRSALAFGLVAAMRAARTPIPASTTDAPLANRRASKPPSLPVDVLGHPGRLRARQGRAQNHGRIFRRIGGNRDLPAGGHRNNRARRIGANGLRSFEDHLRPAAAYLLFRGPRSHPAQSPGARRWHVLSLGHLLFQRRAKADRRPTSRSSTPPKYSPDRSSPS